MSGRVTLGAEEVRLLFLAVAGLCCWPRAWASEEDRAGHSGVGSGK